MKLGIVGVSLVVLSSAAGCTTSDVGVHSQTARQIPAPMGSACASDWKTLATASEAYFANTGAYPADQSALVQAGLLYKDADDFNLAIIGNDYVLTGVGDCSGFDPNTLSKSPEPEPAPDSACDVELKTFQVAWEAYNADYGTPPPSELALVPEFMRVESLGFDLVGSEITPVPGVCA